MSDDTITKLPDPSGISPDPLTDVIRGGARKLIGDRQRSPHSFTVVDIDDRGDISLHALKEPDYRTRVDLDSLPKRIVTPQATLRRMDLAR